MSAITPEMFEKYGSLTHRQHKWIDHKCKWEAMPRFAVMNEWEPPMDDQLCIHGVYPKESCNDNHCVKMWGGK